MICYMKKTGIQFFIIVADKIIIRMTAVSRGRYFNISIAGDVDTCGIIIFVIFACCDRESRNCSFSVIHDCMDIRWEYRICIVIYRNSRVCPPEESLRGVCTVEKLSFDLDISFVWIKCKGCHSFCSVHFIDFAYVYRRRTIFVFFEIKVNRRVSGWTMMLRPS